MPPSDEDEDDAAYDPALEIEYDSADDLDDCGLDDLDSDDEDYVRPPPKKNPTLQETNRGERTFPPDTAERARIVLKSITDNGFADLGMFIDAVFWGTPDCIADDACRYARGSLTTSEEFPAIVRRLANPPGGHAKSSPPVMREFALEHAENAARREMKNIAHLFEIPEGTDPLSLETLTELNFEKLAHELEEGAPFLWLVLVAAGWGKTQVTRNTHKTPHNVIMNVLSMLSYTRSHKRNRLASLWAIYLKSCGLSSRAYDALHAAGIVMSIRWTGRAYKSISTKQLEAMRKTIQTRVWLLAYDNCQIAKRVFSMRITNQPQFYSACAGTIYVFPEHVIYPERFNEDFQAKRREGAKKPFDLPKLIAGNSPEHSARDKRLRDRFVWRILYTLLDSSGFEAYPKDRREDPILSTPPPTFELPTGPDNIVEQFMLKTEDIEEASYKGNIDVITAFLGQLGLDSSVDLKKLAKELLVFIAGDQLTWERLTGLARIRHDNINGFERFDWVFPVFGWFHLVMAFANSLFTQYEGTSAGYGLHLAFDLMTRKGLNKVKTKGPFWHHLDEALHHVAESMILALWIEVAGLPADTKDLSALQAKTPEELQLLAEKIYDEHVSRSAWEEHMHGPKEARDEVRARQLMFINDVIPYIELRDAIKNGDVGRMEDLLHLLLFRFSGGGNPKYTILVLEVLQGLEREWTPDVKYFVRHYGWLINREGKRDSHLPIDQGQEQNIGDIKVTYRSCGPSATIQRIGELSPAIPVFRAVRDHIKWQHKSILSRGTKHTDPNKEDDVATLLTKAVAGKWFKHTPGRTIAQAKDKAPDVMTAGVTELTIKGQFERWFDHRDYARAECQIWPEDSDAGDTSTGEEGSTSGASDAGSGEHGTH